MLDSVSIPIFPTFTSGERSEPEVVLTNSSDDESRPFRFGKYNLTFTEWDTGYWFPSFCAGPCTGMARSAVKSIYDTGTVRISAERKVPVGNIIFQLETSV